jgi:hypothetical protein
MPEVEAPLLGLILPRACIKMVELPRSEYRSENLALVLFLLLLFIPRRILDNL